MQTATLTDKPKYLGLLNAISLAETEAGLYLEAWANATCDEDLACVLRLVAARETSHGEVFCRRIAELGFELRQKPDPKAAARLARYANPKISDLDKLPAHREDPDTLFPDIKQGIADGAYDPMSCNLLQWYINEERDSARRLTEAYGQVRAKAADTRSPAAGVRMAARADAPTAPSADAEAIMACMTAGFARLDKTLEKLAKAVR